MARRKKGKKYVLFGCPCASSEQYCIQGYVGIVEDKVCLVEDRDDALVYDASKPEGHGAPRDWVKLLKEDYGLDVHPVYLND